MADVGVTGSSGALQQRTEAEVPRGAAISLLTAGIVPPMIGFAASVAIVIRGEQAMGATVTQAGAAVSALCLGIGLTGMILSWRWRMPIVLAWSTPGAALLASGAGVITYPLALGAFVTAAMLTITVAMIPALSALVARVPAAIASGMLAGILLPYTEKLLATASIDPALALIPLGTRIVLRPRLPRYAVSLALLVAVLIAIFQGRTVGVPIDSQMPRLMPGVPVFSGAAIASVALPLFIVTLISQNLPGLIVMQTAGYNPSPRRSLFATGLASLATAPFGGLGINLAAIVAAMCTGPEAHPDASRRWKVGIIYGATWIVLGAFATAAVSFLTALPTEVVAVVTGVALLGPLLGAVASLSSVPDEIEAGTITLIATASGIALAGIGSAFWGLACGSAVLMARRVRLPAGGSGTSLGSSGERCVTSQPAGTRKN